MNVRTDIGADPSDADVYNTLPQANIHFLWNMFSVYKVGSQTRLSIDLEANGNLRVI